MLKCKFHPYEPCLTCTANNQPRVLRYMDGGVLWCYGVGQDITEWIEVVW